MLVVSAVMDAESRKKDCPRCAQLEQRVAELEAMVRSLTEQVAKLAAALEDERRRGKRQAAPIWGPVSSTTSPAHSTAPPLPARPGEPIISA